MSLGESEDLHRLGNAANPVRVGLDDVERASRAARPTSSAVRRWCVAISANAASTRFRGALQAPGVERHVVPAKRVLAPDLSAPQARFENSPARDS